MQTQPLAADAAPEILWFGDEEDEDLAHEVELISDFYDSFLRSGPGH